MRRFAPKTNPPPPPPPKTSLDDSERKWKQKDWPVKQRWYIYNVAKLQILANVQIYSHIITLAQNLISQTDTNLSDVNQISVLQQNWINIANNVEPFSWMRIHNKLRIFSFTNIPISISQKCIKMNDWQYRKSVQFSLQTFSKYVYFL